MGTSSLDLSGSLSSTASGSYPSATNGNSYGGGTSMNKVDRILIAHGIFCVIGFLFLLPLGALVARYFRTSTSSWFKAHRVIQGFVAGPVIIVGFALGVSSIVEDGGDHFDSTHTVRHKIARSCLYVSEPRLSDLDSRFSFSTSLKSSSATSSTRSSPNPPSNAAHHKTTSTQFLESLPLGYPFIKSVSGTNLSGPRSPIGTPCPKPPMSSITSGLR